MSTNMIMGFSLMCYGLFSVFLVLVVFILLISLITRITADKKHTHKED